MSSPFSKKFCGKNPVKMSPFNQGGYEGGGDVEGGYYIPTGQMYANMFGKIGQAVSDIEANKKKKENKGVYTTWLAGQVNPTKEEKEAKQIELGLKKIN